MALIENSPRLPFARFAAILGLVCGFLLIALGLFRSCRLFSETGAVDFRNRVVAARLADAGVNPYHYKWRPGADERFYDPSDEPDMRFTRMTSPPTTLAFHRMFSAWEWNTQKAANFAANWAALFGIAIGIALAFSGTRSLRATATIVAVTGIFAVSGSWQFHAERGQQYVYGAFFLTLAAVIPALRAFLPWNGFFAVFAAYFRPTLGLSAVFTFREDRGVRFFAWMSFASIALLVPVFITQPFAYWAEYFASSREWFAHAVGLHTRLSPEYVAAFTPPISADGDAHLALYANFGVWGNVFYHLFQKVAGDLPTYGAGMIATLLLAGTSVYRLYHARREDLLRFTSRFFCAVYLIDLFLPAPRSGYNAVLFFPGILCIALEFVSSRTPAKVRLLLIPVIAGLIFSLNSLIHPLSSPLLVETCFGLGAALSFFRRTNEVEENI